MYATSPNLVLSNVFRRDLTFRVLSMTSLKQYDTAGLKVLLQYESSVVMCHVVRCCCTTECSFVRLFVDARFAFCALPR